MDDDACLPLSAGGVTPHFPSDSEGSMTLTDPSVKPTANWLWSCGCAATTNGYTAGLLHGSRSEGQAYNKQNTDKCLQLQGTKECKQKVLTNKAHAVWASS